MTLSDLIDLEAQLGSDRDADPAALEARDRRLVASGEAATPRPELLRRWLAALRDDEPRGLHPGRAVAGALRGVRAALVLAGLALGWSAAAAVLHYTGQEPVNVWDFLLLFVGVQLALFVLLLASFALPVSALGLPFLGLFRGLVAAVYPRLAARASGGAAARLAEWELLWHRLRSRRSLYHHIEPWLLLGLTQSFGVAFNAGAIVGCLRAIAFSDVAFAWSTTLVQLDSGRFHVLVHSLAWPFGWIWLDAVPTRALVDATRYSRLEGAYVIAGGGRAADPALVGGWWPFLVASLVAYGLVPRLATLLVSLARAARILRRLPLDDAAVQRLVHRLVEPHLETRSLEVEAPRPTVARPGPTLARPATAVERCVAVLWRDVPLSPALTAAVTRHTGCAVPSFHAVGGRDFEEAALAWDRVLHDAGVLVVAEAGEPPDRAALRLLRDLRRALGGNRMLKVLLLEAAAGAVGSPAPRDVATWEEALAALADPYLAVEALPAARP